MSTLDPSVSSLPGSGEGPELLAERIAEVLAEKRFLDSVIEHIPTPVYVKDAAQLRYVRINRAGELGSPLVKGGVCHRPAYWIRSVIGVMEPFDVRHIGASNRQVGRVPNPVASLRHGRLPCGQ